MRTCPCHPCGGGVYFLRGCSPLPPTPPPPPTTSIPPAPRAAPPPPPPPPATSPAGNECAFVHDGLGLAPLLAYQAKASGTYVLQVSAFAYPPVADVNLAGGAADVYRLGITTGPFVRFAMPAGARRGEKATLRCT